MGREIAHLHLGKIVHRYRFSLAPGYLANVAQPYRQVVDHAHVEKQCGTLEHHSDGRQQQRPHERADLLPDPATSIVPDCTGSSPARQRSNVVLPDPESPEYEPFTLCHLEIDVAQRVKIVVPLVDPREPDDLRRRFGVTRRASHDRLPTKRRSSPASTLVSTRNTTATNW